MKLKTTFIIFAVVIAALISVFIISLDIGSWKKLDISKIYDIELSTKLYDRYDAEAAILSGSVNRSYVKLSQLPPFVYKAFIAAEDTRFYAHNGIDVRRIFGAAWANIRSGGYSQGASTITQQLIKLTHLSSEKTFSRKLQEAYLALQLEKRMSKNEILEAYINVVYFGGGAYGIGAASNRYFSKEPAELTISEAAMLAGIIKAPGSYAPHLDMQAAVTRRDYVLHSMKEEGFISENEYDEAKSTDISLNETAFNKYKYGWYTDEAVREACRILDITTEELLGGGYSIYTTLDASMQLAAEEAAANESIYPEAAAQSAIIAIEPESGGILAVTGGRVYVQMGLNRAVYSRRQPGSIIKPISTYAAAVDKYEYLPSSKVYDVQRTYADGYSPGNAGGRYYGQTTMRTALSKSLNAATVDLADTIGISEAVNYARRFGLEVPKEDNNLAFSLGSMSYGVIPAEICAAYAALANGGIYNEPYCIREIRDRNGNLLYEHTSDQEQAVSQETAYIITDMLRTAATDGTASSLKTLGNNVAAKTGTAGLDNGDTSDAWAAVYTPEIAVTVWIGKDNNSDGGMARAVSGSGYAVPACKQFLEDVLPHFNASEFNVPDGVTNVLADRYALEKEGVLRLAPANIPAEYITIEPVRDTASLTTSDLWDAPEAITDLSVSLSDDSIPVLQFTPKDITAEYIILRKCRGMTEEAGVAEFAEGESVLFIDANADMSQINTYSIIPRHKLLYASGITLTGTESCSVTIEPDGIFNDIARIISSDEKIPNVETITDPLF